MIGERLGAEEAERLGLVSFVVDDGTVVDAALALATRLAAGPTRAISASKVAINAYMRMVSSVVMPLSLSAEGHTLASADHREAVRAFQEKRPPEFTGR
jgi:enoyl-CoA hydratase/carnithine racemase